MPRTRRRRRQSLAQKLLIDAHAVWLSARDPRAPVHARLFGLLIAAYALSPIDLIPDFIPVLGLLDDALLIPAGIWLFLKMLPAGLFEEHRAAAAEAAEHPRSRSGVLIILAIWVGLAVFAWSLVRWGYE